eukprot:NODE_325_length_9674_cov_0.932846.p10 type:complete len:172 gc:universal NODE_325_length_9674_cov_0.932846:2403-1888(-)
MSMLPKESPLHDSKSLHQSNPNFCPLIQYQSVQNIFHSEIDFIDILKKKSLKVPYIDTSDLVKLHKSIRDELADVIHGKDVNDLLNLFSSKKHQLTLRTKEVIQECQKMMLQYNSDQVKSLVCFIWEHFVAYPQFISQLCQEEFQDSQIESIENCCKTLRFCIIDLHVFCQ